MQTGTSKVIDFPPLDNGETARPAMLQTALALTDQGFRVFPVQTPDPKAPTGVNEKGEPTGGCSCWNPECEHTGKHPRTPNGLKDATMDARQIRIWWTKWPAANIGIATGDGLVVLDVDPGHDGDSSLADLEELHGPLPATLTVRTGGGGWHHYYQAPGPVRSRNGWREGVDRKADGGYVVAEGSLHASGRRYEREPGPAEIAPAPAWFLEDAPTGKHRSEPKSAPGGDGTFSQGSRNDALTREAGKLRRIGLDDAEIAAALLAMNERRCSPPLSEDEVRQIAGSVSRYPAGEPQPAAWPEGRPIPNGLPPVEPFNSLLLPDSLRPWVSDIAERMQCPPEFAAVAVMVALASVVGRRVGIRPKRQDDWTVVANLWGAVIGRPGLMKTPPVQEVLSPLRRLEIEAKEFYEEAIRAFNDEQELRAIQKDVRKAKAKTDLRKGADLAKVRNDWDSGDDEEPQPPVRARYVVNDTTVEKLGEILEDNPNGVLIFRDEVIGLLRSLDKEGHESARAFYLESWAGNGRFTYDRIGRGTLDIEAATVSVLGCIQPGPLRDYLKSGGSGGDDGLIQRFRLAVWPDVSAEWRNVDRWPDKEARAAAYDVFTRLNQLTREQVGAERDAFDDRAVPFLRFDDAAQEVFDEWRGTLEQRVRSGDEHPAIESHLSKYRSLVPSLALLIHLAEGQGGAVGEVSLHTAIGWAEFLESHARRIYSPVVGLDDVPARALLKHIRNGDLRDGFALKDVYRANWSGLTNSDDAKRAVELLEELGWVRAERLDGKETGGRPKTLYRINPQLEVGE